MVDEGFDGGENLALVVGNETKKLLFVVEGKDEDVDVAGRTLGTACVCEVHTSTLRGGAS